VQEEHAGVFKDKDEEEEDLVEVMVKLSDTTVDN